MQSSEAAHGTDSLGAATGRPRFLDPALAELAAREGDLAAWRVAFARSGVEAPAAVTGDFAVGLRDDAGRIFFAVDRFAIRSLCYRIEGGRLDFAWRADDLGATALSAQSLFDYLYYHVIPSPRTIFRDVHRLPPGHAASFVDGRLAVHRYWTPEFDEQRGPRFAERKEGFRGLLNTAVETAIGPCEPQRVGCFLSGGTDSSTVAGVFGNVTGRPARTYSIGFDAAGYDEMEYARLAARHFRSEHHEYYVTPGDLLHGIPTIATAYDQPFGNSSALPAFFCAKMARDDGIELILAGDGGDELFGGNSRYAMQRILGWYDAVPARLRSGALEPALCTLGSSRIRVLRRAAGYVNQAKVPLPDRLQNFNLLHRLGIESVLSPALLRQVDLQAPAREQRDVWAAARTTSQINRLLAFDWRYTLAENDLPKVCGTTALAGVQVGFPLLDERLLDFSLHLPGSYKLRRLTLRWFFKEALRGFLPDEIITKKKHGFGLPFGVWATHDPALRALAQDALDSLSHRGIVRADFVQSLVTRRLPEAPGYYGEMVWILLILEHWLRGRAPDWRIEQ